MAAKTLFGENSMASLAESRLRRDLRRVKANPFVMPVVMMSLWLGASVTNHAAEPAIGRPATTHRNLNPTEFETLRTKTNHIILDVRTADEFKAGHFEGALPLDVKSADFATAARKLDASKTYLVHCAGGVRSVKACGILAPLGITNLYNLEGGLKAWEKEKGPVGKK